MSDPSTSTPREDWACVVCGQPSVVVEGEAGSNPYCYDHASPTIPEYMAPAQRAEYEERRSDPLAQILGKIRPHVEYKFWACLGHPGQTLDDLIRVQEELGNTVMEVDEANNRILVRQFQADETDVWGCRFCLAQGVIVVVDSEEELLEHADLDHEGWRDNASASG